MKSIVHCPPRNLIYEKFKQSSSVSLKNPIIFEVGIALAYFSPIFYTQVYSDE